MKCQQIKLWKKCHHLFKLSKDDFNFCLTKNHTQNYGYVLWLYLCCILLLSNVVIIVAFFYDQTSCAFHAFSQVSQWELNLLPQSRCVRGSKSIGVAVSNSKAYRCALSIVTNTNTWYQGDCVKKKAIQRLQQFVNFAFNFKGWDAKVVHLIHRLETNPLAGYKIIYLSSRVEKWKWCKNNKFKRCTDVWIELFFYPWNLTWLK